MEGHIRGKAYAKVLGENGIAKPLEQGRMPRVAGLLDVMQVSDVIEVVSADTFKRHVLAHGGGGRDDSFITAASSTTVATSDSASASLYASSTLRTPEGVAAASAAALAPLPARGYRRRSPPSRRAAPFPLEHAALFQLQDGPIILKAGEFFDPNAGAAA